MSGEPEAPVFDASWTEPARSLVRRAIDRHGGWSLWSRLESVSVARFTLQGWLPRLKGLHRTFALPPTLTCYPRRRRTEWGVGASPAISGVYDGGDVRVLDATGQVLVESRAHRRTFAGLRKLRRWRPVDAYYFFGYALATYCAVPFILPGLRFRGPVSSRGLAGVRVEWPAGADVHSLRQSFFFDDTGLVRRNDYVADVVGAGFRGAHLWDDHVAAGGLSLPTRRTVHPRLGTAVLPFTTVLGATLDGFTIRTN
jgi:hypothetical protein